MTRWYSEKKRDHYYKEAKKHGYRARSAFKLLQIQSRHRVLKKGCVVIDLGASPGGWSQVAAKYASLVIAVDLQPMNPLDKVIFVKGDITKDETIDKIRKHISQADVVISDASPNITGNYTMDQARSVWLCENALKIAKEFLREGGNFICKIFEGEDYPEFLEKVKKNFRMVKAHAPKASRKQSSEIYVIAKGYKKKKI
ncbi:MAG: 23S rRNA (uridine(2552)-2'-O)-methyltransferase [Thermoplasmata archaeon]|nr:MAG: 23S rRNA (uridine(2552)-2'-O)-methyltransferase [Thermoplasmata archaeon]